MTLMGKADWIYEPTIDCHVPCCTVFTPSNEATPKLRRCGNGPLTGSAIESGDCGEHES